jgi:DNA-directed RNA polymerase alpha subunit
MNIDLFKQNLVALEAHINGWFIDHPGILENDEELLVELSTRKRAPQILIIQKNQELEETLNLPVKAFLELIPTGRHNSNMRARVTNCLSSKDGYSGENITTVRDIVSKDEWQWCQRRNMGKKMIQAMKSALHQLDPRLELGMKL